MPRVPIQPDDLFRLRTLQDAALAPDGRRVVFTVAHCEQERAPEGKELGPSAEAGSPPPWVERKTLHLLHLEDQTPPRPLTPGTYQDHSPAWSPDGSALAFVSDRSGKAQLYLLPVDGGEARPLTRLPNGIGGSPAWSPDGRRIAFTAPPQDPPPDPEAPYRITRAIYRFDGMGRLDRAVHGIWTVEVESGRVQALLEDGCHNTLPLWSPDGSRLLFLTSLCPTTHDLRTDIRVLEPDGTVRSLLGEWGSALAAAWSPDGQEVLFIGVPWERPIGTQNDLWRIPATGGPPVNLTPELDLQVGGGLQRDMPVQALVRQPRIWVSPDGQEALVQVQQGGQVHVHAVSIHGTSPPQQLTQGPRTCIPVGCHGRGVLLAVSTLDNPFDLHWLDRTSGQERALTDLNREWREQRLWPQVVSLQFTGEDGVPVEGWVLLPPEGQAPHPGFLYIHGGPHSAFGHIFHFDFQMLAGAGYAVLFINQRGSTGYGNAFATAIVGDWGHLDYTDLMAGVDKAVDLGLIDPDRLAVGGLSGGGNLTCWIVGQTDRFKAAVPENPVTNWISFYGVSDIGRWFAVRELGGHPHEIPEVYRRCSPITYAHRCRTPTLLVQGEHDWRCPPEQSEQFFAVLEAVGCPVEMLRLPSSPHGGSIIGRPQIRQAQNQALLEWLQRHVPSR